MNYQGMEYTAAEDITAYSAVTTATADESIEMVDAKAEDVLFIVERAVSSGELVQMDLSKRVYRCRIGGTVAQGALLTGDSTDGRLVATTTSNDKVGAIALEGGSVGEVILVELLPRGTRVVP